MAQFGTARPHSRRTALLAGWLSIAVLVGLLAVAAATTDGAPTHDAELHDGGIWVTNQQWGGLGRQNRPVAQLDAVVWADRDGRPQQHTGLDVLQSGAAVIAVDRAGGSVTPVDTGLAVTRGDATVPVESGQVAMGGEVAGLADPATGKVWLTRVDPTRGVADLSALDAASDPVATVGTGALLEIGVDGTAHVVSANEGTVTTIRPTATGFEEAGTAAVPTGMDATITQVSAVGETTAYLAEDGTLGAGDATADVGRGAMLQQPGGVADAVLAATPEGLLALDVGTGDTTEIATVVGRPIAPVRLGECTFGAWTSGTTATVVSQCGSGAPQRGTITDLPSSAELVFRVNRGQLVLNDMRHGGVWRIDGAVVEEISNWNAFAPRRSDENQKKNDQSTSTRSTPRPRAEDDLLGARTQRTTALHVLDNDGAAKGSVLSIVSVSAPRAEGVDVVVAPDGQSLLVTLSDAAPDTVRFRYTVDDGSGGKAGRDDAGVTLATHADEGTSRPKLREHHRPTTYAVAAGGSIEIPVTGDWRDPEYGDPVTLDRVRGQGGTATISPEGLLRFTAGERGGTRTIEYDVSTGGARASGRLTVDVLTGDDTAPPRPAADVAQGTQGSWITLRPLDNDVPGADPSDLAAELRLAADVAPAGGLEVHTDRETGVVRIRGRTPGTHTLTYTAGFGAARPRKAQIRVDVAARGDTVSAPIPAPDTAVVAGTASRTVDVLANDRDPLGRVLTVTDARPQREDSPVQVAVVDGRWLRVTATEQLRPVTQTVTYRVSNGEAEATGALTLTQRAAVTGAANAPATTDDDVTVRAGDTVSVPVLRNDSTPSGDPVALAVDDTMRPPGRLAVLGQPAVGRAYVDGNQVRFVAPAQVDGPLDVEARYLARNIGDPTAELSSGRLRVHIVPRRRLADNQPPTPRALEARVVQGDQVVVSLPTTDGDPDGDSLSISAVGTGDAPRLGRVEAHGGTRITYRAFPGSVGTDEFDYEVTDAFGETATGTVRIAVVPPSPPPKPVAVDDAVRLDPDRVLSYDVLANDLIPAGSDATAVLADGAPDGVTIDEETGLLTVAPRPGAETLRVPYRVRTGLADDLGELVIRYRSGYDNPPRARTATARPAAGAGTVEVDLRDKISDIDDPREDLTVELMRRAGRRAPPSAVQSGRVRLPVADTPTTWTYRVTDPAGAQSIAVIEVPARPRGAPYLRPEALITLDPGETRTVDIDELVVDPEADPVVLTTAEQIVAAPDRMATVGKTTATTVQLVAGERPGPGVLTVEVADRAELDDPDAHVVVLSVPVQVGEVAPVLSCPSVPVEVTAGTEQSMTVDAVCKVWTSDPARATALRYDAEPGRGLDGVTTGVDGDELTIDATEAAADTRGAVRLQVQGRPEVTAPLLVRVTEPGAPTLEPMAPFRAEPGTTLSVDLAGYLRSPLPPAEREVTVTEVAPVGAAPDAAESSGSRVRLDIPESAGGRLRYQVQVSDSESGQRRAASGILVVEVTGLPSAPTRLQAGPDHLSHVVALSWRAPEDNGGERVRHYEVQIDGGRVRRCPTTSCRITGLENGRDYTFRVRAVTSAGASRSWSNTVTARPDAYTGAVRNLRVTLQRDRQVTLSWDPPARCECSPVRKYRVTWPGSGIRTITGSRTTYPARLGSNGQPVRFTVVPLNDKGLDTNQGPTASVVGMGAGAPAAPGRPRMRWADRADRSAKVVTLSWSPVAPNGPGPTSYQVRRHAGGSTRTICGWTTSRSCRDQVANDGSRYTYTVRAKNAEADSVNERRAGGSALHVSGWSAPVRVEAAAPPEPVRISGFRATGKDGTAALSFDVGASHGRANTVRCTVDGSSCGTWTYPVGGKANVTKTLTGLPDGRSSTVRLVACNGSRGGAGAGAACGPGRSSATVTYGPIGRVALNAGRASETSTRWRAEVDPNGKPVRIVVTLDGATVWSGTSGTGRWSASDVDKVGHGHTSRYRITVRDTTGSSRPQKSRTASATTPPPDPRIAAIYKSGSCNANSCPSAGAGTVPCSATCWYIGVEAVDFPSASTCHREVQGQGRVGSTGTVRNGRQRFSTSWSGPGIRFRIVCDNGAASRWVRWS